jgi:HEAT repeat protein
MERAILTILGRMGAEPKQNTSDNGLIPEPGERPPEHTPASLGRLFAVPLLIVVMIVGCSVVVILLFGWISESREMSVEQLVDQIVTGASRFKAGEGEKVLRVAMLPEDKELWQAAKELAERLESDSPEDLPPEKKPMVAEKLGTILKEAQAAEQTEMGQKMQQFLLQALGRLGQPESVEILIGYALDESQPMGTRRDAITALVLMRSVPDARAAWPLIAPLIESREPVLRVMATLAVGALVDPDNEKAIDVLVDASRSTDREVMWNATLALGRLGRDQAVFGLLDMLDRDYWEKIRVEDQSGNPMDVGLSPQVIEYYLISAMDAAVRVGDPRLKEAVEKLDDDPSLKVRDHAIKTLERWGSADVEPTAERVPPQDSPGGTE